MSEAASVLRGPATALDPSVAATSGPGARLGVPGLELLDDPQEWSAFSRPGAATHGWESHVLIEGMHCAACALTIEDALGRVPGVQACEVSAGSQRARVVWTDAQTRPSQWMQAIERAGYRAVPAYDSLAREQRRVQSRKALWRLGVAGLCMMQVMMYAYPAYVAGAGELSAEMERLLRWASWVLTLPVMLFSCGPFFQSAWRDVRQRRVSMDLPVALGMAITFAVSTAGTFEPQGLFGREVYFDSLTMFVFFLLAGRWLELRLRDRTAGALDALMNRLPDSALRILAGGGSERIAVRRVRPGDRLRVLPGEVFCADGVLLVGSTQVDESLLTGESHPLPRQAGETVIAGSHNLAAPVEMQVEQVGEQTRFAQIVALMESASTTKPTLARLADRIAKPFLLLVLIAAALACAYWWPTDPEHALMVAVSVLVVTCPCALSLATPAAMLAAAGNLARRGVLIRRIDALESLAHADTVVFDKTGTLTQDALRLVAVQVRPGFSQEAALRLAAHLALDSLHPVSRAIVTAARAQGLSVQNAATELVEHAGRGIEGWVPEDGQMIKAGLMRLGSAEFCGVTGGDHTQGVTYLADSQGWLATLELQEDVRAEAAAVVAALRLAGLDLRLWSGDGIAAARRVGAAVGIDQVRGACTPQDKLALVQQAQQEGRRVAMVGDGLNDGPVLAAAEVSFAFGQAVPLARARADCVILSGSLGSVVESVLLARQTLGVVRQNLAWAALYNAVCVPLAVSGHLPAWLAGLGMALSSLVVILNALRLSGKAKIRG